ncbi:3-methylornithine--L-lysine ligase PylC [Sinanaerobacter sp. ZZT-01]|uniref:3-methylornithine--L-lysine ligase PylC n=1 Tax=Sinanaerobacter sp. ZZT-01 TaxID=3111540 RepID=UPI002D76A001|nr:3-methylornithine--L-lysine ligase PylC [Sinanaerobacter sp. ZZT-01]WRR92590.1 3-methylornithine--L-lysine ligase PylC [Sinanaerobacter sp. ZZT-01]
MKTAVIIGGKLQGVEACYLAQKANIKTILIDINPCAPAIGMADEFYCLNVCEKSKELLALLKKGDFILPAMENDEVLQALYELKDAEALNLAFDFSAYAISSSKTASDRLIRENQIPAPVYYPNCQPPYIAKPNSASGSEGVRYIESVKEAETFLKNVPKGDSWVIQEYLDGKSYSIEVIGKPGDYRTYEVTEIHMDDRYDCKRVTAPCPISDALKSNFSAIGIQLAELVHLKGIMDVEVILDKGQLKVLEIDARIPSQTPTVVYQSTGVNFMEELAALFCEGIMPQRDWGEKKHVSFEHFIIKNKKVEGVGEHAVSSCGPLHYYENCFEADEVLTDYEDGEEVLVGTFINSAATQEELEQKRNCMRKKLNHFLTKEDGM